MSAEKNEELASTRSYDYGKGGFRGDGESGKIYVIERHRHIDLNTGLLVVGLGLLVWLVWICSGAWEDIGYMLEYGYCSSGEVELDIDIVRQVDAGGGISRLAE